MGARRGAAHKKAITPSGFKPSVSPEFLEELGALENDDHNCAFAVLDLMRDVFRNPYEPDLIRRCTFLNADNTLFGLPVCPGITVYWKVKALKPHSLLGQDWQLEFLQIERSSRSYRP